jgi:hypothetical protein
MWELIRDSTGEVLRKGTEDQVKSRYFLVLETEDDGDLFLEDPARRQYAWNAYVSPPRWDEI